MTLISLKEKPKHILCPSVYAVLACLTPAGPWLAGGAARKLANGELLGGSDLDLWFRSKQQVEDMKAWLEANDYGLLRTTKTGTETYSNDACVVQLITGKFYSDVQDVLASFDFHLCQFAYDGEQFQWTLAAQSDLRAKQLTVNEVWLPLYTLARVAKYADQGFTIHYKEFLKIADEARQELRDRGEGGSHGA